jgi:DNA-binding transcriptional ArsR family regulator
MFDEGEDVGRKRETRQEHDAEHASANPMRVAILELLEKRSMTASEIKAVLPDNPVLSLVSYHLKVLQDAKLVVDVHGSYSFV